MRAARTLDKKYFTSWSKFKIISQIVPRDTLYQFCTNGSAPLNKRATRALDKKYLETASPPEPLVQIQNNFTELFLMMPSTKIAQMVPLH